MYSKVCYRLELCLVLNHLIPTVLRAERSWKLDCCCFIDLIVQGRTLLIVNTLSSFLVIISLCVAIIYFVLPLTLFLARSSGDE